MLKKNILRFSLPFLALAIMTGCMNDPADDEEQMNNEQRNEEEMNDEEMMEDEMMDDEANTQ